MCKYHTFNFVADILHLYRKWSELSILVFGLSNLIDLVIGSGANYWRFYWWIDWLHANTYMCYQKFHKGTQGARLFDKISTFLLRTKRNSFYWKCSTFQSVHCSVCEWIFGPNVFYSILMMTKFWMSSRSHTQQKIYEKRLCNSVNWPGRKNCIKFNTRINENRRWTFIEYLSMNSILIYVENN